MLSWIESTLNTLGYGGIVFLMFLENVFPPIPSELVMPLGGYTAARGDLSLLGVVIAGMLGSVLGALPLYYLGYFVGQKRLVSWADTYGRWLALDGEDVRRADSWFAKRGRWAIFVGRLVPGIRSLISIPAGVAKMGLPVFLLFTAFGTAAWAFLLAFLGYLLGENYERVSVWLGPVSKVLLGLIAAWLVGRFLTRKFGVELPHRVERDAE